MREKTVRARIRKWLVLFMVLLVLSGVTAFPLQWELSRLVDWTVHAPGFIKDWAQSVYAALSDVNGRYPFLSYGTDWLAFAHLVIAVAFIGPLQDPVRNIWVIHFGMIACLMVFPLAFICGPIRGIPFYWQLIDCSFGLLGLIPLWICRKNILALEKLNLNTI